MACKVEYKSSVSRDLKNIDESPTEESVGFILGNDRRSSHPPFKNGGFLLFPADISQIARLLDKLEDTLSKDPNAGSPLKGQYGGLFKYRIGDYRVIYAKTRDGILVLRIRHRGKAY